MNRRQFLCTAVLAAGAFVATDAAFAAGETITLHKDPNCGCCHLWGEAMQRAGYSIRTIDEPDLAPVKMRYGVPDEMQSCHTAVVGGYFIEGHVPEQALTRLLSEQPDIAGLAVPGMPSGSPGMGDDPDASFEVYAVYKDPSKQPTIYFRAGPKG